MKRPDRPGKGPSGWDMPPGESHCGAEEGAMTQSAAGADPGSVQGREERLLEARMVRRKQVRQQAWMSTLVGVFALALLLLVVDFPWLDSELGPRRSGGFSWQGFRFSAGVDYSSALTFCVAVLGFVAALAVAVAATAWRVPADDERDEIHIQLWSEEISLATTVAAGFSMAVAATQVGTGHPWLLLVGIAVLTTWIAVSLVQKARDDAPLRLRILDQQHIVEWRERDLERLSGFDPSAPRQLPRLLALMTTVCSPFIILLLTVEGESTAVARAGSAAFLIIFLPPMLASWWLFTPLPSGGGIVRVGLIGLRVVLGVVVVGPIAWVTYVIATGDAPGLERAGVALGLLLPYALWTVFAYVGRRKIGLGRVLFEITADSRCRALQAARKELGRLEEQQGPSAGQAFGAGPQSGLGDDGETPDSLRVQRVGTPSASATASARLSCAMMGIMLGSLGPPAARWIAARLRSAGYSSQPYWDR